MLHNQDPVKIAAPWLGPPPATLRADQKWPQITREPQTEVSTKQNIINKCTIHVSMRQNLWLKID